MLVIFNGLHFEVHSQLEKVFERKLLQSKEKAIKHIHCDWEEYIANDKHGLHAISDCEVHDHASRAVKRKLSSDEIKMVCNNCEKTRQEYFKQTKKEIIKMSELIRGEEYGLEILKKAKWKTRKEIFKNQGIEYSVLMDRRIISSLCTRIRASTLIEVAEEIKDPEELEGTLDSALRLYLAGRIAGREMIKRYGKQLTLLCFNGRFNPQNGLKDEFNSQQVTILMHERGYLKGSFVISKGHDPGNPFASYEYWLKRKSILEKI